MPYIKRNPSGMIEAISLKETGDCSEFVESNSEELLKTASIITNNNFEALASDLALVRVIEDLIDTLVKKSVISINDLPQDVQLKLLKRKNLRQQGGFSINTSELIQL